MINRMKYIRLNYRKLYIIIVTLNVCNKTAERIKNGTNLREFPSCFVHHLFFWPYQSARANFSVERAYITCDPSTRIHLAYIILKYLG